MAYATRPPAIFEQGSYCDDLHGLPPTHAQLCREHQWRIGHLLGAIDDRGVSPDDAPILVVIASLYSSVGKQLARAHSTIEDVRAEIRQADRQERDPTIVEAFVGTDEVEEFASSYMPNLRDCLARRRPGCVVLVITDHQDSTVTTTLIPYRAKPRGWWQGVGS